MRRVLLVGLTLLVCGARASLDEFPFYHRTDAIYHAFRQLSVSHPTLVRWEEVRCGLASLACGMACGGDCDLVTVSARGVVLVSDPAPGGQRNRGVRVKQFCSNTARVVLLRGVSCITPTGAPVFAFSRSFGTNPLPTLQLL